MKKRNGNKFYAHEHGTANKKFKLENTSFIEDDDGNIVETIVRDDNGKIILRINQDEKDTTP